MLVFKKHIYELIDSNMYIATEGENALIIDPNINESAILYLREKNVKDILIILTHEHYDHISGVNWLREVFPCRVLCSNACAENLKSITKNGSKFFSVLFLSEDKEKLEEAKLVKPVTCVSDIVFSESKKMEWNGHYIELYETPGHSSGSICIIVDHEYLFTGDSLLKELKVITKLPTGNKKKYLEYTLPFLSSLDKNLWVYPGHGEDGRLKEFL